MALTRQAVVVLQQMRPISESLELVFPSPFYSTKPLSENTFNSAWLHGLQVPGDGPWCSGAVFERGQ